MKQASRKVPDGKMVELSLGFENGNVQKAVIRGDFFLQPPEKLSELERKLEGLEREEEKSDILRELQEVEAELIGFSRQDIAEAFKQAAGGEK